MRTRKEKLQKAEIDISDSVPESTLPFFQLRL